MSYQDLILARAGRRSKARRRAFLAPLRAVVDDQTHRTLAGVAFASGAAQALAEEAGLDWRDFTGARCSGCAGFVADDVRRIIARRKEG